MYLAKHKYTGSSHQLEETPSSHNHVSMTLSKPGTGTFPVLRLELKRPSEVSLVSAGLSCFTLQTEVALVSISALVDQTVPGGYH